MKLSLFSRGFLRLTRPLSLAAVPIQSVPICAVSFLQSRRFSEVQQISRSGDIGTTEKKLAKLLEEELESLGVFSNEEQQQTLEKLGYQLEEKERRVTLRKIVEDCAITCSFDLPDDEFPTDLFDEDQENQEKEPKEEGAEEQPQDEEMDKALEKKMQIEVSIERNKSGEIIKMFGQGAIGKDNNLYLENIRFSENGRKYWFSEMSEPLQEGVFAWMDEIGLDSQLASFIMSYADNYRFSSNRNVLGKFKNFVQDEQKPTSQAKPQTKPKKK